MTEAAKCSLEYARNHGPTPDEIALRLAMSPLQRLEQHERELRLVDELSQCGVLFDWEHGLYSARYLRELAAQHGILGN